MDEERLLKRVMNAREDEREVRGRPRLGWMDGVKKALKRTDRFSGSKPVFLGVAISTFYPFIPIYSRCQISNFFVLGPKTSK